MAALTAARNIRRAGGDSPLSSVAILKCKASTTFYVGGLVSVDTTSGLAEPATSATGKLPVGICEPAIPSLVGADGSYTSGSITSGGTNATFIQVRRGVFPFNNKAADLVDDTCRGRALAYISDDNTVCKTSTGTVIAGRVVDIDSAGQVWVEIY